MTYIEEYCNWINDNPGRVCKKVKKAYEIILDDLKNPKTISYLNPFTGEMETHTFIYDDKKANRPINFIEKYCRQSKGIWSGKPIKLELFQKAFIAALYGFVDSKTGLRKYKKGALFIGRKNGKSTMDSGLALYMLTKDNEGGAEVYSVATQRDQAKIIWEESKKMVKKSPSLDKRIRTLIGGIFYDSTDSVFKPLASQSNSLDGLNSSFVVADEVHAWKDKNLLNVMYDSMSARLQPLLLETSTMGTVRESVFDDEYDYFSNILSGKIEDNTVLPIIYELDDEKEWKNEEAWFKANPALGTIKSIKDLRDKVNRAKNNPKELSNLLCKDFNLRQTSTQTWLTFDELNNEETYEELRDCYCIGGCDLSSTTDLTCATLIIYKNKKLYVKQMYWIPEGNLSYKIENDRIPYDIWVSSGWLRLSQGNKVNYSDVTDWFLEQVNEYGLRPLWIGYDSWNAQYWCDEMKRYGFDMVEVRQGAKTMSQPMKDLRADFMDKKVIYNNNPILKWCLSNTSTKADDNDNIRPVKEKQNLRIDGAVSLIDAYVVYCNYREDYEAYVGE